MLRRLGGLKCGYWHRYSTTSANVFDRGAKRKQRNRAAIAPNADTYDYLKDKVRMLGSPPHSMVMAAVAGR